MKVRKIVAGLAAVSMLAAFSAQAVFAADSVSIKAGDASAKAGEKFTLEVSVEGLPSGGASVMEFAVTYDSKVATITGVSAGKAIPGGVDSAEKLDGVKGFEASYDTAGTVTVTYSTGLSDSTYTVKDGVVAIISGTVAAGTAEGKYPVKVEAISRQTVEGKGDTNKELKAGLIAADGTVTKYTVSGVAGNIVVGETPKDTTEAPKDTTEAPKDTTEAPKDTTEAGKKEEVSLYCDANCDKAIDITDVIAFNKHMLGTQELSAQGKANADVDANGKIEGPDGLNILKRVVGTLEDKDFPIKK
jgi:hypothetical protein